MPANIFRRKKPREAGPQRGRMALTSFLVALAFVAIMVRAWFVQVNDNQKYIGESKRQHQTTVRIPSRRGDIHDRNGRELALTAMVPSAYAIPRLVKSPVDLARQLAPLLQLEPTALQKRLASNRAFIWLKRHISETEADALRELKSKALGLRNEPHRFYPNGGLMGAIIGFAGIDGKGLEGLERDWDKHLRGKQHVISALADARGRRALQFGTRPVEDWSGHSLRLTIDARIQEVAERAVFEQVKAMKAKSAVVVVLDPRNGDILAMAQTPFFDPNAFRTAKPKQWRNRAITDVSEPGSTIKPLLLAAAIDSGRIRRDAIWDGFKGRLKVGRKIIRDVHAAKKLTNAEIIQKSSNVGAVQIGQRLGKEKWHEYLTRFGFGAGTQIGMRGEQSGSLRSHKRWGQIHLATFSYGYGFSVTAVQMARAVGAIANGGLLMKPRLVKEVLDSSGQLVQRFDPSIQRRVVSESAATYTRDAMVTVTQTGGTGRLARVPGYVVAGKTGTAHKVDPLIGAYSREKVVASFVGFAPASNPRLVAYVAVDEPTVEHYGGLVAAPIFAKIAAKALPYLGVKSTQQIQDSYGSLNVVDEQLFVEEIDPQSRPWWKEQSVVAGVSDHIVVPDLKGRPLAEALDLIDALGLKIEAAGAGLVESQKPQAGALLPPSAVVKVALALPGNLRSNRSRSK